MVLGRCGMTMPHAKCVFQPLVPIGQTGLHCYILAVLVNST